MKDITRIKSLYPINSKQQSPFLRNSSSTTQETSWLLGNSMIHYRVHEGPQLDHILRQINPIHTLLCFFMIHGARTQITICRKIYRDISESVCTQLLPNLAWKVQNNQTERFQRILTCVEALCNRSSIYQVASTDFARNVTIKCLQFDPPLHCHGCKKRLTQ